MAYNNQEQQQKAQLVKPQLTTTDAEIIAQMTRRDKWKEFDVEDIFMMWDTFPPGPASIILGDFKRFVRTASAKGLDPLLNDIHFEYRSDKRSATGYKGSIVTHQDGLLKIAHRSELLDGIEQANGEDHRGWYVETNVHKKGCAHPFFFRAYYKEFVATDFNGSPTYMWERSPYNMTAKCSRAGSLRLGFPEELSGIMGPEEMEDDFRNSGPRGGATEPATPTLTVGEKKDPPPQSAPSTPATPVAPPTPPVASAPVVSTQPAASTPVDKPSTPVEEKPSAPSQAPDLSRSGQAPETPAAAYLSRLKVITAPDSAYAKAGVNKKVVDAFLVSYFGCESIGKLPKDAAYGAILDDLLVCLGEGSAETLVADPAKFGQYRSLAASRVSKTGIFRAELKKRFGWEGDLARNAAILMEKFEMTDVDELKNVLLDPAGLMALTLPQLEFCLALAYYGPDPLNAVIKCYNDTKSPMSMMKKTIEAHAGRIDSWTLDMNKLIEGVSKAVNEAKPAPPRPVFGSGAKA